MPKEVFVSEVFSGFYAIAAVFGPAMHRYCAQAAEAVGVSCSGERPHITVFQARFKNLPLKEVAEAMTSSTELVGSPFRLNDVVPYGDAFVFWNVERPGGDDIWSRTQRAVAKPLLPFLDPDRPALRQGMTLSPAARRNIERYGYALYGDECLPHVTLAKPDIVPKTPASFLHEESVRRMVFAELRPEDGSITSVLLATPA